MAQSSSVKTSFATIAALSIALLLPMGGLQAQPSTPPQNIQPPSQAADQQLLTNQQLDQLVAPVALYPDALLSEILMASTYPLEIVEAARWLNNNKSLQGDALKNSVEKQSWDNSVKSLIATPDALNMLNTNLDWTNKLGDAVLAQESDVMDAVQRMRARAQANDKLQTTKEQTVSVKQESGKNLILIEPTQPDTVYVPYYDPAVVYGAWPYPEYPPYVFPRPPYLAAGILATGLAFGTAYAVGRWAAGGYYWGGGMNWNNNNINVNRAINVNNNTINNRWQHNPPHRQGVRYNNANVRNRFGSNNIAGGARNRTNTLNRNGGSAANRNALRPNSGRPNANRPSGNRSAAR
ncbi:MAG: DUF3300 domain-containing protein, partial [Pseudolabrys sp.]